MATSLHSLDFKSLVLLLKVDKDCIYNLEFKRRIVANMRPCVEYYLGDFSKETVQYIQDHIIHRNILTEYYKYLSEPRDENECPTWHKVSLYKARKNCTLLTYTTNITVKYFCGLANKEKVKAKKRSSLIDDFGYRTLLECDQTSEEDSPEMKEAKKRAKAAFQSLDERDQEVIWHLLIEKKHWSIAFEALYDYIHPRPIGGMSSDEVKASWTNKQKQDAMSLLKGRALKDLQDAYYQK